MKKSAVKILIMLCALALLAACGGQPAYYPEMDDYVPEDGQVYEPDGPDDEPEPVLDEPDSLPGKIAIIAHELSSWEVRRCWTDRLVERYGPQNVIVYNWTGWRDSDADMVAIVNEIAENPDIAVLIVNPAEHADDFIGILRQRRDDIIVMYIEDRDVELENADLILRLDADAMTRGFPDTAWELGARTLVYFYNGHHWYWDEDEDDFIMTANEESYWRRYFRERTAQIGMNFVEVDTEDAIQCGSSYAMFMSETIPPLLVEHGYDIVLFGLDNERVFWNWLVDGFIYLPTHPSWFQLYPLSLARELRVIDFHDSLTEDFDIPLLIEDIREHLEYRNHRGLIATLPISTQQLFPLAAAEYGIRWMYDEVPRDGIDANGLERIMVDIIAEHTGLQGHSVSLTEYENHIMVLLDYLIH